jgi:hypothetical protein
MEMLGLQFPVSEFEPLIPDSTTFVGSWEFQRHGISRGLGLQFRNSRISIPNPRLHCHLTPPAPTRGPNPLSTRAVLAAPLSVTRDTRREGTRAPLRSQQGTPLSLDKKGNKPFVYFPQGLLQRCYSRTPSACSSSPCSPRSTPTSNPSPMRSVTFRCSESSARSDAPMACEPSPSPTLLLPWIRRHEDFYRFTQFLSPGHFYRLTPKCPHFYPTPTLWMLSVRLGTGIGGSCLKPGGGDLSRAGT